jgi:hypothetical protein
VPDLIPVENNPFGVNLVPVDHDPYAVNLQPVDYSPEWAAQPAPHGVPQITIGPQQPEGTEGAVAKQGQQIQPVNARPMTGQAAMTALGVPDISSMTPDEQQMFALGAVPMLAAGPEAKVAEEAIPEAAQAIKQGIRAYHGSPYDFERFDLSKIGTGEGAQAYGHGLYFAENPAVAADYKNSLSRTKPWEYEGKPVSGGMYGDSDVPYEVRSAISWLEGNQRPGESTADLIQRRIGDLTKHAAFLRGTNDPGNVNAARMYDSAVSSLSSIDTSKLKAPAGKTYEVSINADPEHFLDWDKPLSEQHPKVQEALKTLPSTNAQWGHSIFSSYGKSPAEASQVLRDAGIPGIKYLDQGSRLPKSDFTVWAPRIGRNEQFEVRGPGNELRGQFSTREEANAFSDSENAKVNPQTSNYVVFDDKLIDIIKKYGLAGLIAGGAAHFKTTPVDYNPFAQQ